MPSPNYDILTVQHSKNIGDAAATAATDGNRWSSVQRDFHLNSAIRRWMIMKATVEDWFALRGYVNEEAQALGSNVKTLVSWTGDVSWIIEAYDATLSLPVKKLQEKNRIYTKTGGNSYLAASATNLLYVVDASTIRVYGAGASDSILLTYVKKHTNLTAAFASDIVVDSPYWSQILDLATAVAMEDDPTPFNVAREQVKQASVERQIPLA